MKSFLLRFFFVTSLTLLGVGCGDKGGGKKSPSAINPLSYNLNPTMAQNLANVTAWYNSAAEGNFGTPGLGFVGTQEERIVKVYAANNGCVSKPIKIFGAELGTFQSCNSSNTVQSQNTVTNFYTPTQNGFSKAGVLRVTNILNGSQGGISNVATSQGPLGVLYIITVTPDINIPTATKVFVIDPAVNSALNPVYSMDSATRTEESLKRIF